MGSLRRAALVGRLVGALAFVVAVAMSHAPLRAAVAVGDAPELSVKTVDGKELSLQQLRGKLVLLDFWATWCGPCMAEAPHMVEVNKRYAEKGLQIVGISLDRDVAKMTQTAKEIGFTWPQYVDTGGPVSTQFGIQGIPHVVLIAPDGKVIWRGHPGDNLDARLEDAFKEHPPQLVDPDTLARAQDLLGQVEAAVTSDDAAGAVRLMGKVPAEASKDEAFAARVAEVQKTLESKAEAMLADVEPQIKAGKYVLAAARLKELTRGLAGTPVADKARARLDALLAEPGVKEKIETAERNAKAAAALAAAQKLKGQKKHELAYKSFKDVAKTFAGTPAAAKASAAVAAYEKDPAFKRKVLEAEAGTKAKAALSMAKSYKSAGKTELARKKLQGIIDEYPGTSFAETARKELEALKK